jgi:hypothetical protein
VRSFRKANEGAGAARLFALGYAKGAYVAFLDADDYWDASLLETARAYLRETDADVLEFNYRRETPDGKLLETGPIRNGDYRGAACLRHYAQTRNSTHYLCNKLFRTRLFTGVCVPDVCIGEDACMLVQATNGAKRMLAVKDVLYHYVMTEGSLCRRAFDLRRLDALRADDFMVARAAEADGPSADHLAYAACAHAANLYCALKRADVPDREAQMRAVREQFDRYWGKIRRRGAVVRCASLKRNGLGDAVSPFPGPLQPAVTATPTCEPRKGGAEAMLTVVVPVYNVRPWLPACVDSLLAQTCREMEILLVDDGSTDESGALCDAYARENPSVRVVHQANAGLSGARNTGILAARGDMPGLRRRGRRGFPGLLRNDAGRHGRPCCDRRSAAWSGFRTAVFPPFRRRAGRPACGRPRRFFTASYHGGIPYVETVVAWNKVIRRAALGDCLFRSG